MCVKAFLGLAPCQVQPHAQPFRVPAQLPHCFPVPRQAAGVALWVLLVVPSVASTVNLSRPEVLTHGGLTSREQLTDTCGVKHLEQESKWKEGKLVWAPWLWPHS